MTTMSRRKKGRTKSLLMLVVVLVLTVALGVIGVTGLQLSKDGSLKLNGWMPTADAKAWPEALALGLDLRGGVYVEYSAAAPEDTEASFDALMEGTMGVIQQRLTDKGYAESTVQRIGTDGIRVEIPDVEDPAAILALIGTPAKLEFKTADGTVFMDGAMVQTASYYYAEGDHQVAFKLTDEGAKIFADVTAANIGRRLGIYLDGELLIDPTVESTITGGSGVINGMGTAANAQTIAAQIQSGALPLDLTQQRVDTVSATLGDDALSTSVTAACIGILLVMALMIFRYRLNGVVASWALCIYIILLFLLLAVLPGIQLTLPGLAGIVLGIGMAVDANVVIFERFNEEVRNGRPLKAAVRAGFKNAMSAVLDANITTLIAAVVLLIFGTGSIQGFAKTLLLGVVVSLFTAVAVTRFLMRNIMNLGVQDPALFTSMKKKDKPSRVKDRSRICAAVSAVVMVAAIVLTFCGRGVNLGIDFTGGLAMQYDMGGAFAESDVAAVLNDMAVGSYTVTTQGAEKSEVTVRIKTVGEDDIQTVQDAFEEKLAAQYPHMVKVGDVNYVGPVAGATLLSNVFWSVIIASVLMLLYIAIRFDFSSGLAAVCGLIHDVLMMLAFMVILRDVIQMNSSFIAAALTIVGYSINNTIIIFDRIRENAKKMPQASRTEVVDRSVRDSLGRTVNTTLTTLITIVMLYILGVDAIKEFALPIIVGILSGVYSANCINGYIWAGLTKFRKKKTA